MNHSKSFIAAGAATLVALASGPVTPAIAQVQAQGGAADTANDPIRTMVGRLELEKYKATIKGLTQFGDRRQGTERNRKAVDWIEAQLKSYGCTNTERIIYTYNQAPPRGAGGGATPAGRAGAGAPAPA